MTIGATAVVALVLLIVGWVIVRLTEETMVADAQNVAEVQARNLAILVEADRSESLLDVDAAGSTIPQVLRAGEIVAISPQMTGVPPLVDSEPVPGQLVTKTVRIELWTGQVTNYRIFAIGSETPAGPATVVAGVSLAESENVLDRLTRLLLVSFASVLLVIAGIAWLVVGRALSPVERIRREVENISEHDLGQRVTLPAHRDELRRLAETMNHMLGRLQTSADAQAAFIADASHELRSPLASLRVNWKLPPPIRRRSRQRS